METLADKIILTLSFLVLRRTMLCNCYRDETDTSLRVVVRATDVVRYTKNLMMLVRIA